LKVESDVKHGFRTPHKTVVDPMAERVSEAKKQVDFYLEKLQYQRNFGKRDPLI